MIVVNQVSATFIARFGVARVMTTAVGLGLLAWVDRDTAYAAIVLPSQILQGAGISQRQFCRPRTFRNIKLGLSAV